MCERRTHFGPGFLIVWATRPEAGSVGRLRASLLTTDDLAWPGAILLDDRTYIGLSSAGDPSARSELNSADDSPDAYGYLIRDGASRIAGLVANCLAIPGVWWDFPLLHAVPGSRTMADDGGGGNIEVSFLLASSECLACDAAQPLDVRTYSAGPTDLAVIALVDHPLGEIAFVPSAPPSLLDF